MCWIKFRLLTYVVKFATTKSRKRLQPNIVGLSSSRPNRVGLSVLNECVLNEQSIMSVRTPFHYSLISSLVVVEEIKQTGLRFNMDQ